MTTLEIFLFVIIFLMIVELYWMIQKRTDIEDLSQKIKEQFKIDDDIEN